MTREKLEQSPPLESSENQDPESLQQELKRAEAKIDDYLQKMMDSEDPKLQEFARKELEKQTSRLETEKSTLALPESRAATEPEAPEAKEKREETFWEKRVREVIAEVQKAISSFNLEIITDPQKKQKMETEIDRRSKSLSRILEDENLKKQRGVLKGLTGWGLNFFAIVTREEGLEWQRLKNKVWPVFVEQIHRKLGILTIDQVGIPFARNDHLMLEGPTPVSGKNVLVKEIIKPGFKASAISLQRSPKELEQFPEIAETPEKDLKRFINRSIREQAHITTE